MNNPFNRTICVFDLETTGKDPAEARIVEISILRVEPDGTETSKTWRCNPGVTIPEPAAEVHGLRDADVENEPCFSEIIDEVIDLLDGADLVGYNSNSYDIPLLAEEVDRVNDQIDPFEASYYSLDLDNRNIVDAKVAFYKKNPRDLQAAHQYYCGQSFDGAHSADADVRATLNILRSQSQMYNEMNSIEDAAQYTDQNPNKIDLQGRLYRDADGDPAFGFGKYKDWKAKEVLRYDSGYFNWLLRQEFTKRINPILMQMKKDS